MSDIPGAWFHCSRCGALFRAAADADQRGPCPECGGDPAVAGEAVAPTEPALVRRKVRKPKDRPEQSSKRQRHSRKKARALAIFVIVWAVLLGSMAIWVKRIAPDSSGSTVADTEAASSQAIEDARLLQDEVDGCLNRLLHFVTASNISGQSPHVLRADKVLPDMARALQLNPIFPVEGTISPLPYNVIHTPAGPAIEIMAKHGDSKQIEAIFFEEKGEWKIDWHAYARAGSGPWPLFVASKGKDEGQFRLLARERIGANGRDAEFIALVLYSPRPGQPGEAVSPSPEIRVARASEMGRAIEEAFTSRTKDLGAFDSGVVKFDPDGMIRLNVKVTRDGEEERVFQISELIATHWMEQPLVK